MGEDLFRKRMIDNYPFYSMACLLYALFFVFCLYKNDAGITFPLWMGGTCFFAVLIMQKSGVKVKKGSAFYIAIVCLLGISVCLTGDRRIIVMNKFLIFAVMTVMLIYNFYDVSSWKPIKFIEMMFNMVIISIGCIARPFSDRSARKQMERQMQQPEDRKKVGKYVLIGLVACLPIVIIVLALLANADAVFAEQLKKIFIDISFWNIFGNVIKMALLGFVIFMVSYMWTAWLGKREYATDSRDEGKGEPVIGITIMAVLSLVYIVFCWIQIRYLFIGGITGKAALPDGMSYSGYARTGFFQLLFVSVINMLVVMLGIYCFRKNKFLSVLMCVITFCTYIMIASSAMRMVLYIQYKYLTFLRMWVLFMLLVIAVLMAGVVINIFKRDFKLFWYSFAVVAVLYTCFSFARPDYWIAKVNTDNMTEDTKYEFFADTPVYEDAEYLIEKLGTDAAPVIYDCEGRVLSSDEVNKYKENISRYTENIGVRNWNLSRFMAWEVE